MLNGVLGKWKIQLEELLWKDIFLLYLRNEIIGIIRIKIFLNNQLEKKVANFLLPIKW